MTPDEIDDLVDKWHEDPTITVSLRDYLRMTEEEYQRWLESSSFKGFVGSIK